MNTNNRQKCQNPSQIKAYISLIFNFLHYNILLTYDLLAQLNKQGLGNKNHHPKLGRVLKGLAFITLPPNLVIFYPRPGINIFLIYTTYPKISFQNIPSNRLRECPCLLARLLIGYTCFLTYLIHLHDTCRNLL